MDSDPGEEDEIRRISWVFAPDPKALFLPLFIWSWVWNRTCIESAAPGSSYFGCLAAVGDQASPVVPPKPPAPLSLPKLISPFPPLLKTVILSHPQVQKPLPPLQVIHLSPLGGLLWRLKRAPPGTPPCPVECSSPLPGLPKVPSGPRTSSLGPIAPPSIPSVCPGSKKSLFEHVRAAVRPGHLGLLGQVATAVNNPKYGPKLGVDLERGRADRRGKVQVGDPYLNEGGNSAIDEDDELIPPENSKMLREEDSGIDKQCLREEDSEVGNIQGDLRKEISLGSS
ncbi:hypothetical protein NE237_014274 [Protea cynaroides]|uniref:Uncharacterized protein n=1 Tax=Protea cynaroides TaxID=273540 RepID=A0A9Q0GLR6_9MAGN|nr:hypothetical protein NE237_014274 [Protea cynaroides]